MTSGELFGAADRCQPPPTGAAGERVVDQPAFEHRFAHVHDRVVQHPLGKNRGVDRALLRVENAERRATPKRETALIQLSPHYRQFHLQIGREPPNRFTVPLAFRRFCKRQPQILRLDDARPQTAFGLHGFAAAPVSTASTAAPNFSTRAGPTPSIFSRAAALATRCCTIAASCSLVNTA